MTYDESTTTVHPTPQDLPHTIEEWLDGCELRLLHPGLVAERLRRQGWNRLAADMVANDYRSRFNEHRLGYGALLISTGVTALTAGGTGHTLAAGLEGPVDRYALAIWLATLLCSLPLTVWSHLWAARVDREDTVAVWSRSRRQLAVLLLWGCGIVGGLRLLVYAVELVAYLVGADWIAAGSLGAGALNVAIALGIAVPTGYWAYRFLHRFDREDPTIPPQRRPRNPASSEAVRGGRP